MPFPLLLLTIFMGLSGASRGGQSVPQALELPGRLGVLSGDPAPGSARVGARFASLAVSPDGLLFIDATGSALLEKAGGQARTLAYVGQESADGGTIASFKSVATGADGTIAFLAVLADRREGIFRIGPERGLPETVAVVQDTLELRDGPATIGFLYPPVLTAEGAVVASIGFLEIPGAVVSFPRGAEPLIVIESGDPLGPGAFAFPLAGPAVNPAGRIALSAMLESGEGVVATLAPGEDPLALAVFPPPTGPSSPFPTSIAPAINERGEVTFLTLESGSIRVRFVTQGVSIVIAAPGTPAPGGGTFSEISEFPPAIDAAGNVMFGALRSSGRRGFYLMGISRVVLAEEGQTAGPAGSLLRVGTNPLSGAAAVFGSDGILHFAATATAAAGIFSAGTVPTGLEVGSEEPISEPRFVTFLDSRVPVGGGGPDLARGGLMIFDARITGGARGLFVRQGSGAILPLAVDGDPAPGGGRFVGDRFAYHSINEAGTFAFLGQAFDPGAPSALSLFYGSIDGGEIRRIVDTEILPPGGSLPGSPGVSDRVKAAPSRLNRLGQIAVPVVQSDQTSVLMGYDGSELFRVAGPGDSVPGGATIWTAFTGSLFTGQPIPPALDDGGRVLFGAQTSNDVALFAARVAPGGEGDLTRVLGTGDEVEGGRLTPFELQALDADESGRIAFQSIYSEEFDFADFVTDGGPAARLVARFDPILDRGFALSVQPLLALLGEGKVGYGVNLFDGSEVILAGDPGAEDDSLVLAATGDPSPEGGVYLSFRSGLRNPGRLASDGLGTVAFAAATTAGPEAIILFGETNVSPVADAGSDLAIECSGPNGTEVALDGRSSSDPDGDPLTYHWTGPFGEATGPQPIVTLPLGVSIVTLVVEDGQATSSPDTVRVEVRDAQAPSLEVAASPALLWPPDGRFEDVVVSVRTSDRCDPRPGVVLLEVTNSEPGTGRPGSSVAGASTGTDDRRVGLRADRSGTGPGRTYILTYRAIDASGNFAEASATVLVPHDRP